MTNSVILLNKTNYASNSEQIIIILLYTMKFYAKKCDAYCLTIDFFFIKSTYQQLFKHLTIIYF